MITNPPWNSADDGQLVKLAAQRFSAAEIASQLCRSASSVRNRANRLHLNLARQNTDQRFRRPPTEPSEPGLKRGDRVRLSELGRERQPRMLNVQGTVVSASRLPGSVGVLFEGRRAIVLIHRSYLEIADTKMESTLQSAGEIASIGLREQG